jgi:cytochrome b561
MSEILGPIGILLLIRLIWSHATRSSTEEKSQRETMGETKKQAATYFYLYVLFMVVSLFLRWLLV